MLHIQLNAADNVVCVKPEFSMAYVCVSKPPGKSAQARGISMAYLCDKPELSMAYSHGWSPQGLNKKNMHHAQHQPTCE